jgi:hypothetical protein
MDAAPVVHRPLDSVDDEHRHRSPSRFELQPELLLHGREERRTFAGIGVGRTRQARPLRCVHERDLVIAVRPVSSVTTVSSASDSETASAIIVVPLDVNVPVVVSWLVRRAPRGVQSTLALRSRGPRTPGRAQARRGFVLLGLRRDVVALGVDPRRPADDPRARHQVGLEQQHANRRVGFDGGAWLGVAAGWRG